jgi:EAL domain-containing protein (putative c-di-GMP-specific phosphodiesterase class I)/GGDEF domain-containing protein
MRLTAAIGQAVERLTIGHFFGLLVLAFAASAFWHGAEGMVFTGAIAGAFVLGAMNRRDLFGLRKALPAVQRSGRERLETGLLDRTDALCLAVEIDNIDEIRERLGQRGTEDLCAQMAHRVRGCVRGGDGFSVLGHGRYGVRLRHSEGLRLEQAVHAGLRLQGCADRPLQADGLDVRVSLGVGFAHADRLEGLEKRPSLLQAAERALAAAQAAGPRSLRAFDPDMMRQPASPARDTANTDARALQRALDAGQIGPWFQPQIDTDTGLVSGFEALARWQHPKRGTLGPGDFLKLAEGAGMMGLITDTMLDQALAQLVAWDKAGLRVPTVSVNMGVSDLSDPTLVDRVRWVLDRHVCARTILDLGKLGCGIELDDFGTGSASLASIRRFDVKRIKIDRSLVSALDRDRRQHAMVAAILTMAEQLDVRVLAEGVETPAEHAALAELGVRDVQGFAIARPMPADTATAWIRRRFADIGGRRPERLVLAAELAPKTEGHNLGPGGETA